MNINMNTKFKTHNTSVRSEKIKYIVIHYVGATGDAEANVNYYNQPTTTNASADYFVGFAGDIWQYNPEPLKRYCWAVGGKKLNNNGYLHGIAKNSNCINIEMCVRNYGSKTDTSKDWYFEDATVSSTIELTKKLMEDYNIDIDHVIRHNSVTGKNCPLPYVYNHTKHTWSAFKSALVEQKSGWIYEDNNWRFYLDNNRRVRSDWYYYNGKWAWFDEEGNAIHDTWLEYKENWYVFGSDCYMKEQEWYSYKGDEYYLKSDGIMAKNSYIKSKEPTNNNYYYIDEEGKWIESKTTSNPVGDIVI